MSSNKPDCIASLLSAASQEDPGSAAMGSQLMHDLQMAAQSLLTASESLDEDFGLYSSSFPFLGVLGESVKSILSRSTALCTALLNLESGAYLGEYVFSQVPLKRVIENSCRSFQAYANQREVSLDLSGVRFLTVWASESHLGLLLDNLVQNAIKYSYRGNQKDQRLRSVRISATPNGEYVTVKISNYGVGITPDELPRLFNPGFRGAIAEAEGRTGSGMGLYTSRKIAYDFNGRLSLTSKRRGEEDESPYLTEATLDLPYRKQR